MSDAPAPLSAICGEAFALVLQLRAADELPPAGDLERKIHGVLDRIKARASEAGIAGSDVEHARYALVAFIDETLLTHGSPAKDAWLAGALQMRYFNENTAGEGFFARLDELRRGRGGRETLEVYYLCLVLGFEGRYRLSCGGELEALVSELRRELVLSAGSVALAPHGERPDEARPTAERRVPVLPLAGGFIALAVLLLSALSCVVGGAARTQSSRIQNLAQALEASER
jgi:type VI secretion system protein ImpK